MNLPTITIISFMVFLIILLVFLVVKFIDIKHFRTMLGKKTKIDKLIEEINSFINND